MVKTGLIIAGVVAGAVVLGSAVTLVTAPMRSFTGVVERTLDSGNVLRTYELFHDRKTGFETRVRQIIQTQRTLDAETSAAERARIRVDLAAQQQNCREIAAGYNADAAKLNRSIFQDRNLPERLNMSECG